MTWAGRAWKSRGGLKRDVNDDLFSKIIRFGQRACAMCGRVRDLECAHIMGRKYYATRFMFYPIKNAIPLCNFCHSWFDEHQIPTLIWMENRRVFGYKEESFTFLIEKCGYTWDQLQRLYTWAKGNTSPQHYKFEKKNITIRLRAELNRLEAM